MRKLLKWQSLQTNKYLRSCAKCENLSKKVSKTMIVHCIEMAISKRNVIDKEYKWCGYKHEMFSSLYAFVWTQSTKRAALQIHCNQAPYVAQIRWFSRRQKCFCFQPTNTNPNKLLQTRKRKSFKAQHSQVKRFLNKQTPKTPCRLNLVGRICQINVARVRQLYLHRRKPNQFQLSKAHWNAHNNPNLRIKSAEWMNGGNQS